MKFLKITFKVLIALIILGAISFFGMDYYLQNPAPLDEKRVKYSKQFNGEVFYNDGPMVEVGFSDMPTIFAQETEPFEVPSKPIPVIEITKEQLEKLPKGETHFFNLGHSSILLWMDDAFWLVDPIFSERASPFTFAGPKKFHGNPIELADLPKIKGVIISHNHYDHLDKPSIVALKDNVEQFMVPLGVGSNLTEWGVERAKVKEFDWHESLKLGNLLWTSTPSFHFSGRGLTDRDSTLWSSWVVEGDGEKIYFSGDSGYFDGFKKIGDQYGPFNISFIETGAYNPLWPSTHMFPEKSVQAAKDLNSAVMVPIHNGTFDLSYHNWFDPLERSYKTSQELGVSFLKPKFGEQMKLQTLPKGTLWWRELMEQ